MGWKEMEYVKLRSQIIMQLHKLYELLAAAILLFSHYHFLCVCLLSVLALYMWNNTSGCGKMHCFRNSCSSFSRNLKNNIVETIQ